MMAVDLKFKHWFDCKNGKLIFDQRKAYRTDVSHFDGRRGYIVFYDESENKPVSKENRAWYFKVLIGSLALRHVFYAMSPLTIHHTLMEMFLGEEIEVDGKAEIWYPSLSQLNSKQFNDYTEMVQYFAEENGCIIESVNSYKF